MLPKLSDFIKATLLNTIMINLITQHIRYQLLYKDMFQELTIWEISLHRRMLYKIVGQADESVLGQSWDVIDFR
jgi:hypothetical protein